MRLVKGYDLSFGDDVLVGVCLFDWCWLFELEGVFVEDVVYEVYLVFVGVV